MKITMTIRAADGAELTASWINGDESDARETACREAFIRGVARHGGQIICIAAA